jgi:hypothetical protein
LGAVHELEDAGNGVFEMEVEAEKVEAAAIRTCRAHILLLE